MRKRETIFKVPFQCRHWMLLIAAAGLFMFLGVPFAGAMNLYENDCYSVRWDNTLKYSMGFRVAGTDSSLIDDPNFDDGDRNFNRGLTSTRWDLLSEMDIIYNKNWGVRVSGSAWYDPVYLRKNDNDSPATYNGVNAHDQFDSDTREMVGGSGELLDAFVFGKFNLLCDNMPMSFRIGRHSLLWGEALFAARNGIMYGQGPIDVWKASGVPSTQAKELFMPVNQFSFTLRLMDNLTMLGFLDFEWRRTRLPAAGGYFSDADVVDAGARKLWVPGTPPGVAAFYRGDDLGGGPNTGGFGQKTDFGQGGVALKTRIEKIDGDFGIYWMRFHDNTPNIYLYPGKNVTGPGQKVGEYALVYGKAIQTVGMSLGSKIGPVNVSGEVSGRFNSPLVSAPQLIGIPPVAGGHLTADNNHHPAYAVGNTMHANVSGIYFLNEGPRIAGVRMWQGGTVLGEISWNQVIHVTRNQDAMDPARDHHAWGVRMVAEPSYYQVIPGWDLVLPLGFGMSLSGKSGVDSKFNNHDGDHVGDFSVGMKATYQSLWISGITYTNWFGSSTNNHLKDRDMFSMYLQRTF